MIDLVYFTFMFIIVYLLYISAITHHFSLNFTKQKKRPFWQFVEEEFENNQKSNAFRELKLFLKEFINSVWLSDKKLKKIEKKNNLENFEELIQKYKNRINNSFKNFLAFFLILIFINWVGFKYLT